MDLIQYRSDGIGYSFLTYRSPPSYSYYVPFSIKSNITYGIENTTILGDYWYWLYCTVTIFKNVDRKRP